MELLAVDVTTLVFVEDQPENPEILIAPPANCSLHQLLEVVLNYHFSAENIRFHQVEGFVNQVVHPLYRLLHLPLQVRFVVVVDNGQKYAHEDVEGDGLEDDEEDGVEAVLVVGGHHDVRVVCRCHQDVQVPVGVGKGLQRIQNIF